MDEDSFAKTLIPELFKHNNYASFVRQLNMYGFHKKVGLSDNSMKASENKKKAPSRYENPYFRRGRPELLWLIHKPKAAAATKKGHESKVELDDEADHQSWHNPTTDMTGPSRDMVTIPRHELDTMRNDLMELRMQNTQIRKAIAQMSRQNNIFQTQALTFQQMHQKYQQKYDQQDSQIKAIMTFLATFYNRNLDSQQGPNVGHVFNSMKINQAGNIVDIGDVPDAQLDLPVRQSTPSKRRLLLPAPEARNTTSPIQPVRPRSSNQPLPKFPSNPPLKQPNPNDLKDPSDVLGLLDSIANPRTPPVPMASSNFDFNSALEHMQTADGKSPLTDQQRNDTLQHMTRFAYGNNATNTPMTAITDPLTTELPSAGSDGVSPSGNLGVDVNFPLGDSSDIDSFLNQPFSIEQIDQLQKQQDDKIQNLAQRAGPLSPNGMIPGVSFGEGDTQPPEYSLVWENEPWNP